MRPLRMNLYWGGQIVILPGLGVSYDPPVPRSTILVRGRVNFAEMVDLIYTEMGLRREAFKLNVFYRYPEIVGSSVIFCPLKLQNDIAVEAFFEAVDQLSSLVAELFIETEAVAPVVEPPMYQTQHSYTSSLNSFQNPFVPSSSNLPPPVYTQPRASSMSIGQCSQLARDFEDDFNIDPFANAEPDFEGNYNDDYGGLGVGGGDEDDDEDDYDLEKETDVSSIPPSSDEEIEELEPEFSDSDDDSLHSESNNEGDDTRNLNMGGMRFGTSNISRVLRFLNDIGDGQNPDPTDDKNMFKNRKHGKLEEARIRNEMDQKTPRKPKCCTLCGGTGHDRRTCHLR